jgi:molecular chaperone DnaK
MPMIRDMLAACSPDTPLKSTGQTLAVAHGAALHAACLRMQDTPLEAAYSDPAVRNTLQKMDHSSVNAHSLGVATKSRTSAHARNITIIPRNTRLPCAGTRTFGKGKSSDSVRVRILEGESPDAGECRVIGQCHIRDLPPDLPPGSPVEVTFAYTEEGRIHISAVATTVNLAGTVTLDRTESLPEEVVEQQAADLSDWELV